MMHLLRVLKGRWQMHGTFPGVGRERDIVFSGFLGAAASW